MSDVKEIKRRNSYSIEQYLIDSIREVLGLKHLYRKPKESPLWNAHPFSDGNSRTAKGGNSGFIKVEL